MHLLEARRWGVWGMAAMLAGTSVKAGLAITEVMSDAAMTQNGTPVQFSGPDYVEITNYGTNTVDVSEYSMGDGSATPESIVFRQIRTIETNEVIIIAHYEEGEPFNTPDTFRDLWGIPATSSLRIFFWTALFGLNAGGEEVSLWDGDGNLVDRAVVPAAQEGRSLIPSEPTGDLTLSCSPGLEHCFLAATRDDVGSPGLAPAPIPLQCLEEPEPLLKCVDSRATLCFLAGGLPRPRYQWFFEGQPIPNATAPCYSITNVQTNQAGNYSVQVSNCLGSILTCGPVELAITDEPFAPILRSAPVDLEAYDGQMVCLEVVVDACPPASFQWSRNGEPLEGMTDSLLRFPASLDLDNDYYTVVISNDLGNISGVGVVLSVVPARPLLITEVMAWTNPTLPGEPEHHDWVEVTNTNTTRAVNLKGYRIKDAPNIKKAFRIEEDVILQPCESAILVEDISAADFRRWWGEEMLPPTLQIVTFSGFGFSSGGETVHLWNAAAKRDEDIAVQAAFTELFEEERGHTWECGTDPVFMDICMLTSIAGQRGAFEAAEGGDVGSPGVYGEFPKPFLRLTRVGTNLQITCRVFPGRSYRLLSTEELCSGCAGAWQPVPGTTTIIGGTSLVTTTLPWSDQAPTRFYKLVEL